jgi:hypothetical protein
LSAFCRTGLSDYENSLPVKSLEIAGQGLFIGCYPSITGSSPMRRKHSCQLRQHIMDGSFAKSATSLFVAFHLFVITLFALPVEGHWIKGIRVDMSPYMIALGMNETWQTFAPRPKSAEEFMKAVVVTLRGKTEVYTFPRMEDLSYADRYRKERFRKFEESLLCKDCSGLWPDVERYVARKYETPMDPSDRVVLIKFESAIDPKRGLVGDDEHAVPTILGELSVQPEDLQ